LRRSAVGRIVGCSRSHERQVRNTRRQTHATLRPSKGTPQLPNRHMREAMPV
jgi:hypothetical protein